MPEASLDTNDIDLLLVKREKARLLEERLNLIKTYGIKYYRPHAGQDKFHRAGCKFRKRYVRTGNRWGKSTAGCAEDVAWLLNHRPWYPESDEACRGGIPQHPVKLLTTGADWEKLAEVWSSEETGKIWKFIPKGFVKKVHRNSVGVIDLISFTNGSSWRFESVKGFKNNPLGSESSDWDAIHYDEPLPEKMRKALARGLIDRGGSEWYTLTPLTEFWINDYFFPADTGGKPRSDVWTLCGTTYDNTHLSPENIAEYENDLTDDEKECRIHGIPLELAGLVYKEFKWDTHVLTSPLPGWNEFNDPPKDWTIYYSIDPHPRTPHAILFCAVGPTGFHVYFTDYFKAVTANELAEAVLNVNKNRVIGRGIMDPLGFIEEPSTKTTFATELANYGLYVDKATKALDTGIIRVRTQLKNNAIAFTPNCARTLWEIQRYCWDPEKERPIDANDHMMENLYRLELADMRWLDPAWRNVSIDDIEIVRPELDLESVSFSD